MGNERQSLDRKTIENVINVIYCVSTYLLGIIPEACFVVVELNWTILRKMVCIISKGSRILVYLNIYHRMFANPFLHDRIF
jgi:hypothetical protein